MAATRAADSATRLPRPFEGIYGVSLLTAVLSLVPYIIVTSACTLFREQVTQDIGAGKTGLEIINGLSTAGYAFGALVGGDLINRFEQRPLFLICESLFILSCASRSALLHLADARDHRPEGGIALYLLGGAGLPCPDLIAWIEHNRPAIGSPPLAGKLRES